MYPLNMTSAAGFAVANTEDEHKALTALGYGPAFVAQAQADAPAAPDPDAAYKAELSEKLTALGGTPDKRWGVKRLEEEIAARG